MTVCSPKHNWDSESSWLSDWAGSQQKNVGVLLIEIESFYLDTFNQSMLADASQLKSSLASDDRFCTEINHFYPDF